MITVWMPVYNEARNLQRAIDSVLGQSYTPFELIISDNHSTDGSGAIIDDAVRKDWRIRKVMPPTHLKSYWHMRYVYDDVLARSDTMRYSIFIGGHDEWKPNLLEILLARAEVEPRAAIVYTDSYEIDDAGAVLRQYCGWVQVKDLQRSLVPHHVLLGLTHNLCWGGLWREELRRRIEYRDPCIGLDHLLIAEAALLGDLIYQPGSAVMLGRAPDHAEGIEAYVRKHIPERNQKIPMLDFIHQLEWACLLVDKAVQGDGFAGQDAAANMLKHSLVLAYCVKYWQNLNAFEGGFQAFFGHPTIQGIMGSSTIAMAQFNGLLEQVMQAAQAYDAE